MAYERLDPHPWQSNYLVLRALRVQLAAEARRRLGGRTGLELIDVGCGARPYEPLFAPYVDRYVGADIAPGPGVDVVAPAEALPLEAEAFDCALCSQVLEHAQDPRAVVAELNRVLRPGGVAFASTHGAYRYHPNPEDFWRWTHAGLNRLFQEGASWHSVDVHPNGDVGAALVTLMAAELAAAAEPMRVEPLLRPLFLGLNLAGHTIDRALRRVALQRVPSLSPNYLVVAVRGNASVASDR